MSITTNLTTSLTSSLTTPLTNFSPIDLGSLGAWYDATNSSTLDLSGTSVMNWLDLSGNGRTAITSTASVPLDAAPVLTSNIINGKPALRFFGSNAGGTVNKNYFTFNGDFLAGTDYTVVTVEQRSNMGGSLLNRIFIGSDGTGTTNAYLRIGYNLSTTLAWNQGNANSYTTPVAAYASPINRNHILRYGSVAGKQWHINGVSQTLTDGGGANQFAPLTSYTNPRIGSSSAVNYYSGYIGEIMFFTKRLTDSEMSLVQTYINNKWGF